MSNALSTPSPRNGVTTSSAAGTDPAALTDVRSLCMLVAERVFTAATGDKPAPIDEVRRIVDEILNATAWPPTGKTSGVHLDGILMDPTFESFERWARSKYQNPGEQMQVLNSYASELWDDVARRGTVAGAAAPTLVCAKCGADRLKQGCMGDLLSCGMQGVAHCAPR